MVTDTLARIECGPGTGWKIAPGGVGGGGKFTEGWTNFAALAVQSSLYGY